MNRYLIPFELTDRRPNRFYALLDTLEPESPESEGPFVASFDALDADQFDGVPRRPGYDDEYFSELGIFVLDIAFRDRGSMAAFGLQADESQVPWFEFQVDDLGGAQPILQYRNLFDADPIERSLRSRSSTLPYGTVARLEKEFSLDDVPEADPTDIDSCLDAVGSVDWAAVYDVGQGNWNGLCGPNGAPVLYFDFGGAVMRDTATFPTTAFTDFCASEHPLVVLSHWDWDHWSSGQRFANATQLTWLVPNQRLGAVHRTFAQSVIQNGSLLVWPSQLTHRERHQIRIEKCIHSGRNHSGLALILSERPRFSGQHMLFTGDARYSAIPSGLSVDYTAVVIPHHGADMGNNFAPVCPGVAYNRLVYSYGAPNSNQHPSALTQQRHQNQGWIYPTAGATSHVGETKDRQSNGLGHIELEWRQTNRLRTVPCRGKSCTLSPTQ